MNVVIAIWYDSTLQIFKRESFNQMFMCRVLALGMDELWLLITALSKTDELYDGLMIMIKECFHQLVFCSAQPANLCLKIDR